MKKRVVRFVAALMVAVIAVLGVVPVTSSAIVPLGLVQSALASYVTSAGYRLYNDQGTGQDILGSLGELYDEYVTLNSKTISGNLATLAYLANSPLIYTDNSGQICINAVAANIMQDFADWLQAQYSVTVGSSTPTQVVNPSVGGYTFPTWQSSGIVMVQSLADVFDFYHWAVGSSPISFHLSSDVASAVSSFLSSHRNDAISVKVLTNDSGGFGGWSPITIVAKPATVGSNLNLSYDSSILTLQSYGVGSGDGQIDITSYKTENRGSMYVGYSDQGSSFWASNINVGVQVGNPGLAISLAHAVTDVVGRAADDDAVVVGVGAGVGATAQDIAGLVADGVKAGTLEPSVSVVAESVIDTPVQPYPDIEGLGLPQLGAALTDRFPFCIPWDFVGALKLLNAEPIPPVFDVPLVPDSVKSRWGVTGNTTLHVDLTTQEYTKVFLAIRWGSLISFCIGLTLLTKRLIWTA